MSLSGKIALITGGSGSIGKSEDAANGGFYFASQDSSWTTGSILVVDGRFLNQIIS